MRNVVVLVVAETYGKKIRKSGVNTSRTDMGHSSLLVKFYVNLKNYVDKSNFKENFVQSKNRVCIVLFSYPPPL